MRTFVQFHPDGTHSATVQIMQDDVAAPIYPRQVDVSKMRLLAPPERLKYNFIDQTFIEVISIKE